jgi:hypothetical protein
VIGGSFILALVARAIQPPLLLLAHSWMEKRRRRPPPSALGGGPDHHGPFGFGLHPPEDEPT